MAMPPKVTTATEKLVILKVIIYSDLKLFLEKYIADFDLLISSHFKSTSLKK